MLPLLTTLLFLAQDPGRTCRGCDEELKQLMDDIVEYLDETSPQADIIEDAVESGDLMTRSFGRGGGMPAGLWLPALIPSIGLKLTFPSPYGRTEQLQWELFLLWKVRK
ncbi:MAG: hypothetical protein ABIJ56_05485 [Pseudomonadota bacterium]